MTVDEVADSVERERSTAYRAIQRLVEAGTIHPLDISNAPPMWEAVSIGHHHHFYCTKCQQVYKIPKRVPKLDTLVPAGFTMSDHSITIYGICAECGKAP